MKNVKEAAMSGGEAADNRPRIDTTFLQPKRRELLPQRSIRVRHLIISRAHRCSRPTDAFDETHPFHKRTYDVVSRGFISSRAVVVDLVVACNEHTCAHL